MNQLNVDLNELNIETPPHLDHITFEHEKFFSGYETLNALIYSRLVFDIVTYTLDPQVLSRFRARRVIYHHASKPIEDFIIQYQQTHNVHSKLYIGYENTKPKVVYVGSWNCVRPTYLDLMVKCGQKDAKFLVKYFNNLWQQCSTSHDSTTNPIVSLS